MLEIHCGDRDGKFAVSAYDYTRGYGTNLNLTATTLVSDAIAADFNGGLLQDLVAIRGKLWTDRIYNPDIARMLGPVIELQTAIKSGSLFCITIVSDLNAIGY